MSSRSTSFVTLNYYHVFNHAVGGEEIFANDRERRRFLLTLWFYLPIQPQVRLAHYLGMRPEIQQALIKDINSRPRLVKIFAHSLVGNHFHLLVQQLCDNGISTYLRRVENSYSKYRNIKYHRKGALFINPFGARHITSEEQMLHVFRYVVINRYSAGFFSKKEMIKEDIWGSLPYYMNRQLDEKKIVDTSFILEIFNDRDKLLSFVMDQVDYQRTLEGIKHLI